MKRRNFLKSGGLAAAGLLLPPLVQATGKTRLERIGIQLYTVRDLMARDTAGTLEALAAIGYDEVEFVGFHGHSPADVRAMLDNTGIAAPSGHVLVESILSSSEQIIEAAQVVGLKYLVLGWLKPEERKSLDDYRSLAELCNRFGEQCRMAGIQFAYHNHEFEFERLEDQRPMDLLLAETDDSLMKVELDFYWIAFAGADAFEYFVKHPGRFPLCHIKDMATDRKMVDVGAGTIDFSSLLSAGKQAGLEHYFIERDDSPDPMATAAASYAAVRQLVF
jgi:sugar phosphate isomerase/epimerase